MQSKIKLAIEKFYSRNWKEQDFLTEDDVRCRLFYFLKVELANDKNASIHSEIRWYGNTGEKLKYRSDIVIIDSRDLTTDSNIFKLPSKGYGFNKYYSIIEIKLRRPNDKNSNLKFNDIIRDDINKLIEIKQKTVENEVEDEKKYFVIAFDKREKKKLLLSVDDTNQYEDINWQNWNIYQDA